MPVRKKTTEQPPISDATFLSALATKTPLMLDMPGLLFVEARKHIDRGTKKLVQLQTELSKHRERLTSAVTRNQTDTEEDAWTDVIQGVGSFEPTFGTTITHLATADVLLVAAAESYINAIAAHVLESRETEHFDKLSPVGKWLFLPRIMKLKWVPSLSRGPLQKFSLLVARRNRVIHPKVIKVRGTSEVESFVEQLRLDAKSAHDGAAAVEELIRGVSLAWRGAYGPDWLEPTKALKRPPCFILGNVDAPMRLGRRSAKRKRAGA